jgi:hypothetical protein
MEKPVINIQNRRHASPPEMDDGSSPRYLTQFSAVVQASLLPSATHRRPGTEIDLMDAWRGNSGDLLIVID